jgi:cobaltochelatase CobS
MDYKDFNQVIKHYIDVDKESPYNNRRNRLRKIADCMFGEMSPEARMACDSSILAIGKSRLEEFKIKPTFNSFRGRLSPAVLEQLVIHATYSLNNEVHFDTSVSAWVADSVGIICEGDLGHLPFGSTHMSDQHEELLENVKDIFAVEGAVSKKEIKVEIKEEIKRGAGMGSEKRIELDDHLKKAVNAILENLGVSVDSINSQMDDLVSDAATAKEEASILATRLATAMSAVSAPTVVAADGKIPEGNVLMRRAKDIFSVEKSEEKMRDTLLNFDVPFFQWEGVHPDVPSIDLNYKFDMTALFRVLQGIVDSNNSYLYGHTGTGKSTLVEQVCAHLNFPLVRVNFDSEISRMDLIGRDTLVTVDGQTVSKFVDGVLPDALSRPCLLLCDEVDFVRPDVMYVFQRVLEGNGLLISEDGGRKVMANPWFRLVATANTVGQGDDTAMYQGARPQSMATLDRFENWVEMSYMSKGVETNWLKGVTDGLNTDEAKLFIKYASEHRKAFTSGKIMQPLSPRGLRAMAKRYVTVLWLTSDTKESLREAFEATVLARCTQQDRTILDGLYQRVAG